MANHRRFTLEQIQCSLENVNVDALAGQQALLPGHLEDRLRHLAVLYGMLRPILRIVGGVRILSRQWRRALDLLGRAIEAVLEHAEMPTDKVGGDQEAF